MAGISPRRAGVSPARAGAVSASALNLVQARVSAELGRERAEGLPLKAAYERVARRLGLTARRVRAFHHREVPADAVTADELLAADTAFVAELDAAMARIETLRGRVNAEGMDDPLRGSPPSPMAPPGEGGWGPRVALGQGAAAMARLVREGGE